MSRLDAKQIPALIRSSEGVKTIKKYSDGGSLFLLTRNGNGYWSYQWREGDSYRTKMLGTAGTTRGDMTLAKARIKRGGLADDRAEGRTPKARGVTAGRRAIGRPRRGSGKPFGELVTEYLEGYWLHGRDGSEPVWMAGKPVAENWAGGLDGQQAKTYRRTLLGHGIGKLDAAEITTEDVQRHLAQWDDRPVTRARVRGFVEVLLDNAKARQLRTGDNPAAKVVFDHLPSPKAAKVESHPAMHSENVPALMRELVAMGDPTARALAFLILTATRTDDVRLARWREIDIKRKLWIIPAFYPDGTPRIKERVEHRVGLTDAAIKIMGKPGADNEHIFPSPSKGALYPIWDNGMNHLMKRLLRDKRITTVENGRCPVPHGFRACFSGDWAAKNGYPLELREMALEHAVGDAVVKSYNRPQAELYKVRIPMMQKWSDFLMPRQPSKRFRQNTSLHLSESRRDD